MRKAIFSHFMVFLTLVSFLSPGMSAFADDRPLCVGDEVISSNGWKGTVKGIYPDGTVSVYYPGSSDGKYTQKPSDLARTRGESQGLRVGEKVISSDGWEGTVQGIYPDGRFSVYYSGSSDGRYVQNSSELAREKGESHGLHIGDEVISSNGWNGVVQGIYPDGKLSVYYAGSANGRYVQSPSELARVDGCTDVPSCLHQMSFITNSGQNGLLLEAKISQTQSKGILAEPVSAGEQKVPVSSAAAAI